MRNALASAVGILVPASPPPSPLPPGTVTLSDHHHRLLTLLVAQEWMSGAAEIVGVSRNAISAAMAKTGTRRATATVICRKLDELAAHWKADQAKRGLLDAAVAADENFAKG